MAPQEDSVNFDIIESHKENIQALPSGRSARKLVELFSPSQGASSSRQALAPQLTPTPNPTEVKSVNDAIRAEYEAELAAFNPEEQDDPLDIYDRYVRWTLDAYPSASATPQSQLHLLLERATRAFVGSAQYRNDARYLKMWLHYIRMFSDAPREAFVFLSRHQIGDQLALYYEEFAAYLEGERLWAQAEEVYKMGIEKEARPISRLTRKFGEFKQRRAALPEGAEDQSNSVPVLPVVRKALGVKSDPFMAAGVERLPRDPQAPRPNMGVGGAAAAGPSKPKSKLAIFSDADAAAQQPALGSLGAGSKGWDSIGSLSDRKKENTLEPKPWAGEVLKAGGQKPAQKMQVFRDTTKKTTTNPMMTMNNQQLSQSHIPIHHSQSQVTVNPVTGKRERVFVDLRVIYPTPDEPGTELSFEEIWAARRGWLDVVWDDERKKRPLDAMLTPRRGENMEDLTLEMASTKIVAYHDVLKLDENGKPIYPEHKAGRSAKKKKMIEVNQTQIIKVKLDSPSGRPKMKKRGSTSEPTMTLHTKAATDDIYDIFNAPIKPAANPSLSGDENRYDSDDYTCGVDDTSRNLATSEVGDEITVVEAVEETDVADEDDDVKSEWSDFTARKHIPDYQGGGDEDHEMTDVLDEELDGQPETSHSQVNHNRFSDENSRQSGHPFAQQPLPATEESFARNRSLFVPVPPADYVPTRRPYRDPVEMANNRLPFMTPITERTEFSSIDVTYHHPNMHHPILTKTPSKAPGHDHDLRDDMSVDGEEEEDQYSENEDEDMLEPESSPLREIPEEDEEEEEPQKKFSPIPVFHDQPVAPRSPLAVKSVTTSPPTHLAVSPLAPRLPGPIIKELQCNPVDDLIRKKILANIYPPLTSYEGFYDHRHEKFRKGAEIRKFAQAQSTASKRGRKSTSADKRDSLNEPHPITLQLPGNPSTNYTIKKELGAGAYAPVYLVENSKPTRTAPQTVGYGYGQQRNDENNNLPAHLIRAPREALKMEQPPTAWEFYMMRISHTRLLAANTPLHTRALASLSPALELHLYQDEGFLFLPFFQHGTLLDVINLFRSESSGVMDEQLAMFFTVELLRAVEALHSVGIMHGDVKVDNCLLRLPTNTDILPTNQYHADGSGGWAARGLMLIDFGRGIDFKAFSEDVQFKADWKPTAQDCAEMREGRPWTWQIDYHGLAGVVHALLFGKYIDTVPCGSRSFTTHGSGGGNDQKRYKIRENLKRYWQTDIWGHCFDLLLNPGSYVDEEDGQPGKMKPVLKGLRTVRERMEGWLEENGERGVGLRGWMGKVEAWSRGRR
ncbi:hypothetical protein B0T09DRAFT_188431 [Sordaria sp. MPI-SDFR-AT-0083]|nr:hypothetical protein B0T09DRAFT_188431 [Sordaria sp. MPI-SDFR-AT-0083]